MEKRTRGHFMLASTKPSNLFPRCHGLKQNADDSQYPPRVRHQIVVITLSSVQFTRVSAFRWLYLLEAYLLLCLYISSPKVHLFPVKLGCALTWSLSCRWPKGYYTLGTTSVYRVLFAPPMSCLHL